MLLVTKLYREKWPFTLNEQPLPSECTKLTQNYPFYANDTVMLHCVSRKIVRLLG